MRLKIIKASVKATLILPVDTSLCTKCGEKKVRCHICGYMYCKVCDCYHLENCRDAMRP